MPAIRITFKGAEYVIPEDRAFAAGDEVERFITLRGIGREMADPRLGVVSKAYGALLRFAGCKVSDAEVKAELVRHVDGTPGGLSAAINKSLGDLAMVIMEFAPDLETPVAGDTDEGEQPGKTEAS